MINLLLNILTYQNNNKNLWSIFSNMRYGVYYYTIKFQLKTSPMRGEIKKINYIRGVIWTKWYSLGGKMNQTIV